MAAIAVENSYENDLKQAVDSKITYSCGKSFAQFIHTTRLRSIDLYGSEKINNHIKRRREKYSLDLYRLKFRLGPVATRARRACV